jgi:PcfJ-like protein
MLNPAPRNCGADRGCHCNMSDLLEIKVEPGRAVLLTDKCGVYGLAIGWLDYDRGSYRQTSVIYRPDRLDECHGRAVLQPIPRLGVPWSRFDEEGVADQLLTALLARAGFMRESWRAPGPGAWWSTLPIIQNANRRRYHGLRRKAVAITNELIRQALTAAPPEALKLARRFPLKKRCDVYKAITRSPRMMQLTEIFPLLAWKIINRDHPEAKQLVEAGVKLNTIASLMKVPMALRGLKPGAVLDHLIYWDTFAELEDKLIRATLPATTEAQRQWVAAVFEASRIGGPYVGWTARNYHLLGCTTKNAAAADIIDIGDWVRSSYVADVPKYTQRLLSGRLDCGNDLDFGQQCVTRRFSPDMSLATVRELSSAWHEAIALSDPNTNVPLPAPWRNATRIGNISVVPLDTAAAIAAEGRAMHHCARTLIAKVKCGDSYLFSARDGDQRIATIEVGRNGDGTFINQMRGACNSMLPKPLQAKLTRWSRERDKWNLPIREPVKAVDSDDLPF